MPCYNSYHDILRAPDGQAEEDWALPAYEHWICVEFPLLTQDYLSGLTHCLPLRSASIAAAIKTWQYERIFFGSTGKYVVTRLQNLSEPFSPYCEIRRRATRCYHGNAQSHAYEINPHHPESHARTCLSVLDTLVVQVLSDISSAGPIDRKSPLKLRSREPKSDCFPDQDPSS